MGTKRIIVIGGSAAGPKAGIESPPDDEDAEINYLSESIRPLDGFVRISLLRRRFF